MLNGHSYKNSKSNRINESIASSKSISKESKQVSTAAVLGLKTLSQSISLDRPVLSSLTKNLGADEVFPSLRLLLKCT